MTETRMEGLAGLIGRMKEYLLQKKEEGETDIYLSPEGRTAMEKVLRKARGVRTLRELEEIMRDCHKCPLGAGRINLVFGEGSERADIVFIGEAPGAEEDKQGRPFVGRAGQLLTNMIKKMGYTREDVYIGNILKCRPPGNRDPLPEEMEQCFPYLAKQLEIIKPKVIVTLGKHASHALLGLKTPITKLRGNLGNFRGIPVMPTFHTAYLLRNPNKKWDVWEDMQKVLKIVGRSPK
ncbi:uracil-DNA glycosylase [bacterium]|nr:uracil-DNA glycosylase [bacterium]